MSDLTHIDPVTGEARMVDVSEKAVTSRQAVAEGYVVMAPATLSLIMDGKLPKGDVLGAARLAGIMGAKKTSDLIPLCHPLPIAGATVTLAPAGPDRIRIESCVKVTGVTGVEMEALTAVSMAALTLYDMAKAVDKAMHIEGVRLLLKEGGKSGTYRVEK